MTPEILHLLIRLEPDKEKCARLLTEHTIGHRHLPSTEQELQRELRKIYAAAEESANRHAQQHAENDNAAHEAVMVAHLAQQAMAAALAAGATTEEAIAAEKAASEAFTGSGSSVSMQD